MKVKSYWKIVVGVLISLFASSAGNAKKPVITDAQRTTAGTMLETARPDEKLKTPYPTKATIKYPTEGRSKIIEHPTEGVAEIRYPTEGDTVVNLPSALSNKDVPIITDDEADLTKYKNRPVIIMNKDGSGFIRIPLVSEEQELLDEYQENKR